MPTIPKPVINGGAIVSNKLPLAFVGMSPAGRISITVGSITVIDILPAGDMPTKAKGSLLDTIAPPLITGLGDVYKRQRFQEYQGHQ